MEISLEPKTDKEYWNVYGVAPACVGLSRNEITERLSNELVRLKIERPNTYVYWAHEVVFSGFHMGEKEKRVDFVKFEPYFSHMRMDVGSIECGTFTYYEIKSCLEDIKSGHGVCFDGDENYMVMPVECFEKYKKALHDGKLEHLNNDLFRFSILLYGRRRNGRYAFVETSSAYESTCRKRSATEILLCMMRAMIANSGHSAIYHHVDRMGANNNADGARQIPEKLE